MEKYYFTDYNGTDVDCGNYRHLSELIYSKA